MARTGTIVGERASTRLAEKDVGESPLVVRENVDDSNLKGLRLIVVHELVRACVLVSLRER